MVRRRHRNHSRPYGVRRRIFLLPLRLHQLDLLPRPGRQPRRRLHLQLARQPVGRRSQGEFRLRGLCQGGCLRFERRLSRHDAQSALRPAFPGESQGAIFPAEIAWTPKFNGLAGSYQLGGWWSSDGAPNVATSINGEPILVSGLPGVPGHGRYGFSTVLQQQVALAPDNPDKKNNGLNVFLLASYADRRTSTTDYQIFGGIVQYGLGPWRPRDGYGIAVGTTHVNPNIANGQTVANTLGRRSRLCAAQRIRNGSLVWVADDALAEFETRRAIRGLSGRLYSPDQPQCVCVGR